MSAHPCLPVHRADHRGQWRRKVSLGLGLVAALGLGCHRREATKVVIPEPAQPREVSASQPVEDTTPKAPPQIDSQEFGRMQTVLELARMYRSKGMLSQADRTLSDLLETVHHPVNRTRALFELSQVYVAQGEYDKAVNLFKDNPTDQPLESAFRRLYLANIYQMQQKYAAAEKLYLALMDDPLAQQDLSLLSNVTSELSRLYTTQGKSEKAIALYQRVLETLPNGTQRSPQAVKAAAQARLQMASFHLQRRQYEEALTLLKGLLDQARTEPNLTIEATSARELYTSALLQAGHNEEAANNLRARLKEQPASHLFALLIQAADRLADGGAPAKAVDHFAYIAQNGPPNLHDRARFSLGSAQLAMGREADGTRTLTSLIDDTENPGMRSDAKLLLARHLEESGQPRKAVEAYQALLEDQRHRAIARQALERLSGGQ